jgi:hypothetical protein
MYYKQAIESSPLQAYGSALLFSPKQSVVRKLFQHEGLEGIARLERVPADARGP